MVGPSSHRIVPVIFSGTTVPASSGGGVIARVVQLWVPNSPSPHAAAIGTTLGWFDAR